MEENNSQTNNKNNLKTVRTYMSDMADTVRANEISVIKVALAEQNKQAREDLYRKAEGTPTKKIFWVIGGIILIAGSIYGATFLFKAKAVKDIPPVIQKEGAIISYDEVTKINFIDGDNLIDKINVVKKETGELKKNGLLKYISIEKDVNGIKEKINTSKLLSSLSFTGPSSLVRSLSDYHMVGIYTSKTSEASNNIDPNLFLILQSVDYEFTYAGMLEWEKTMGGDMLNVFELKTKYNRTQINEIKWKDVVINNKDTRVLFNEDNQPVLYYMFTDKHNLIITDNVNTIKEIISRLILQNVKPS